ncbi:uroporphyrinogen decarboxylase family protein [Halarsenatibacter silvermanii]|uniref:Uroporphyrinogen decarboxylase n=1 Tax=Halarsenatibacter silvermanii TaxID=321763 RepID=A0A1G9GUN1_9FIRM|nr:uroporphyrinogen decarboxylase family protein [Halarsenatibacter silvermanii]SDL04265.1 uroporphyrinogen decarboxylase [Halarsenatibacter silvermanii]
MNSRERFELTIEHREPDRVPVDLGGSIVTSLTAGAYEQLAEYKELDAEAEMIDIVQGLIEPPEILKQEYGCDFARLAMGDPEGWELEIKDGRFADEFGIVRQQAGIYYDIVEFPLADADIDDLETFDWPDPSDPGRTEGLKKKARQLYQESDYVLIADMIFGGLFEQAQRLRGYENFMLDLKMNQKFAHALLDKLLEIYTDFYRKYIDAVGDYVHIFALADDLGTQNNLMISPQTYREFIKPRQRELYDFIREKSGETSIFHHSCGAIFPLIGDLIEIGVDILQSVQTSAAGMDPEKLKQEYGSDITFHGAIDVQQMLPKAEPREVKEKCQEIIEIMSEDGGYIFSPAHNIQPDTPPENIEAMFAAVREVN